MKILVHRAGYTYIKKGKGFIPGENTTENASISLSKEYVDGIEIDIQYSSDRIPFVLHQDIKKLTSEEVAFRYPDKKSLYQWVEFLKNNRSYSDKIVYFDVKKNPLLKDPREVQKLLNMLQPLPCTIYIGSCDWDFLKIISSLRSEYGIDLKIFAMFPEPVFPRISIEKVKQSFKTGEIEGVHFFFIDSFWKELLSYIFKRGDFVTVTDFIKGEGSRSGNSYRMPIPNLFLFQDIYYLKSSKFVKFAKENNLMVIGASTGSINSLRKMKEMGCDILMVNVAQDARLIA